MRECETIRDLKKEFKQIKSGVAGDTIWMAKASLFLIETILERLPPAKKSKQRRRPTAWQKFVADGTRSGLSLQEIARRWREQKRPKLHRTA